jgi:hypothetical protein
MPTDEAIKTLRKCLELIATAELNPNNYNDDDVMELNSAMLWAYKYGTAALDSLAVEPSDCMYADHRCPGYAHCTYPEKETHEGKCALSPKAVEPSEDAREFAQEVFSAIEDVYKVDGYKKASSLITDRDERIRRECADMVVAEYKSLRGSLSKDDVIPHLVRAIMGGKE